MRLVETELHGVDESAAPATPILQVKVPITTSEGMAIINCGEELRGCPIVNAKV